MVYENPKDLMAALGVEREPKPVEKVIAAIADYERRNVSRSDAELAMERKVSIRTVQRARAIMRKQTGDREECG